MKQIDEKLVVYKQHKAFLDNLAIASGKKIPKEKKETAKTHEGRQDGY